MHRRIAPLLLAALIALPVVAPTSAAEPAGSGGPGASQAPSTTPDPGLEPAPEPSEAPIPSPEPDGSPTPAEPPADDPVPAEEPAPAAPDPSTEPAPSAAEPARDGRPDTTDRYIVMLRSEADTTALVSKVRKRDGIKVQRTFTRSLRGFAAKLDARQKRDLLADPNVLAIVPDEVIELTQTIPRGISRVGGKLNAVAKINGVDERVNADVAIVDTGVSYHPDLNVAGGYNCSTSDRSLWRDRNNHGTHVAGTVGALDNSYGVVGAAPGARVWGVKILNDDGYGLISWYICGLDWILAQRDPGDSSRPLFEAVNMSVTKSGSDDKNCGFSNNDPLHQAICRVVAGGITVVAAAANDSHNASRNIPASYNEVITVSALADTDGKAGGKGGNACYSWGSYDKDDTFANFSNYGKDVDIMAPGKCILSTISTSSGYATLSGTSMAAPTVAGAVALYKASRPNATPQEVRELLRYLGNLNWKVSTDPDAYHEPLLDVTRIGTLGTFALTPGAAAPRVEGAATISLPLTVVRSSTFFERVKLSLTSVPNGWSATLGTSSLMGWSANSTSVRIVVPGNASPGSYDIGVRGTNQGRSVDVALRVVVADDQPTAKAPVPSFKSKVQLGDSTLKVRAKWDPATDPSSSITGYEVQLSKDGGSWGSTIARGASQRVASWTLALGANYRFRVRAVDTVGNWSPWAESASRRIHAVDDRNSSVARSGNWARKSSAGAYRATVSGSRSAKASLSMKFTGTGIAVVGPKSSKRGKARVYIDGTYIKTIKMRSSTSINRLVVFKRAFSSSGTHTIVLKPTGTGTYPQFRLDAFVVLK